MVPKITKGRSAYGAIRYDHSKGRREEHKNPRRVAGNVAGKTWRERAKAMDEHARTARPDVSRPIHRTALRLAPEDRKLSDREWRDVAERYVNRQGFIDCPWEATRHADDHIHVTVSRVKWDGTLAKDSHDYAKAQAACRDAERRHGLVNAAERYDRAQPQITRKERESAGRRETAPEREQLREKLRSAEHAAGGTREGYEAALRREGVTYRANVAKTGRVSGYSYGLDGHRDKHGAQVYFKGSDLGKNYAWSRAQARMGIERPETAQQQRGPVTREQARQRAQRAAAERNSTQQRETERPGNAGNVRGDRDNASRAEKPPTAPRRQHTQQAPEEKTQARMEQGSSAKKQISAGQGMTRAQAAQLAAEAVRRRQQEEQRRQREQDRGGRER